MDTTALKKLTYVLPLLITLLACDCLLAAEASMQVSRREGYVGSPIPIKLIISDALDDTPPTMPDVEGLTVERLSTPNVSTQMTSINGVTTTRRTTEWTYLVNALAAGTYTIPEFIIEVDGNAFRTKSIDLTFFSSEADDLLRVAIDGDPARIYLGESTNLTLRIWIKPYKDIQYGTELSSRDMWNLVDPESNWGPFSSTMSELYAQRQAPRGRLVTVPGEQSEPGLAYLYELEIEDWPDRLGPVAAGDVRIGMQYPLSLTRSRGFFNSGLAIDEARPIFASPERLDVTVAPLPKEGQPAWFSGAVGRFVFDVSATPTDVAVGDPITLTMRVTDRGQRPANMELLQAPKIDRMKQLDEEFRVPREQLGGTVQGSTKVFTQTIRATSDSVSEIPSLPFTFFEPGDDEYVTSWSKPIPLQVRSSTTVSSSNVLSAGGTIKTSPDELKNVSGGILANYTGTDLLTDQSVDPSIGLIILLVLPPIVFLAIAAVNQKRIRLQNDTGLARSRSADRTAGDALQRAETSSQISGALAGYVADRLDLPAAALTRHEIRGHLDRLSVPPDIIEQVDDVLSRCEQLQYAGNDSHPDPALLDSAASCLKSLQGARLR